MVKDVEKVIMLSQDADSIPFDLQEFRTIIYRQTIQGARDLRAKLVEALLFVADRTAFRLRVRDGENTRLPYKVMGPDHCAYDFEIAPSIFARDGAKCSLRVTRYVVGEAPALVYNGGIGLMVGEKRPLPSFPGQLQLESVMGNVAVFLVTKKQA